MNHSLIRAVRDRAVCAVNSFRVQMLTKKRSSRCSTILITSAFSLPTNNRRCGGASWTRILREGFTTYRGRRVDLLDVARRREILVLKPSGDYGGRGVTLGWECGDDDWNRAIKEAAGAAFVVQERVEVLQESFPTLAGGKIVYEDRYVDFDPYTWTGDDVEGAGVRLSSSALLNVTAGGGSATPMMIVEE